MGLIDRESGIWNRISSGPSRTRRVRWDLESGMWNASSLMLDRVEPRAAQRGRAARRDRIVRLTKTRPARPVPKITSDAGSGTAEIWIVAYRSVLLSMW